MSVGRKMICNTPDCKAKLKLLILSLFSHVLFAIKQPKRSQLLGVLGLHEVSSGWEVAACAHWGEGFPFTVLGGTSMTGYSSAHANA